MGFISDYRANTSYVYDEEFKVEPGIHWVRVKDAQVKDIKGGTREIIEVKMEVKDGQGLYPYIIWDGDGFNAQATEFFDVMGIERNDWDFSHWLGKIAKGNFYLSKKATVTDSNGVEHPKMMMKLVISPELKAKIVQEHPIATPELMAKAAAIPPQNVNRATTMQEAPLASSQEVPGFPFPEDVPF